MRGILLNDVVLVNRFDSPPGINIPAIAALSADQNSWLFKDGAVGGIKLGGIGACESLTGTWREINNATNSAATRSRIEQGPRVKLHPGHVVR